MAASIPLRDLHAIFAPRDPASSLRESAMQFAIMGRTFDAQFTRELAEEAAATSGAVWEALYSDFARQQAERVERFMGVSK